ncbi:hypothetical protein PtA15_4A567 [Puccinia triticina]|uniref:Uncharacterized protein n=1 Tax=Puccinia triticina TaxID=208348 RepID=A0ABY7CJ20_9BASI|nr:uncharacterized protein PtA15_4A567 [Puccinia triticina]WAQ84116.1 hypothetical protein PtA15_4A567 [Puccinia triticina]
MGFSHEQRPGSRIHSKGPLFSTHCSAWCLHKSSPPAKSETDIKLHSLPSVLLSLARAPPAMDVSSSDQSEEAILKIKAELASAAASGATLPFAKFLEFDLAKMAAGRGPGQLLSKAVQGVVRLASGRVRRGA